MKLESLQWIIFIDNYRVNVLLSLEEAQKWGRVLSDTFPKSAVVLKARKK